MTVTTQGVYCGTGPEDLFDVPQVLSLPILDTVESEVALGTAGSSLRAVKTATELMDWAVHTDLEIEDIENAAAAWLNAKGDGKKECRLKLELVDNVYQELLTAKAQELLDTAGCASPGAGSPCLRWKQSCGGQGCAAELSRKWNNL